MKGVEHQFHSLLAIIRQPPQSRSSNPHALGAESESFEDVSAAADAAIDVDVNAAGSSGDAFGKGVQGGRDAIQLTATVIGDLGTAWRVSIRGKMWVTRGDEQ
jgi:hypothetical protein